ncbi:beta/alpha barrel domain-containing protein [Sphingobacterium yanglingense]|uniref:Hydroxymethylglutaryl-CoA lyase n=1 Tax=Sphingobacterium yanglingense TaxID=1437280 RepID=A0A4R6W3Z6_9SPHI|nr:hydroxymethylglutaryl-CoA lyase [Sphingobacterium yanglingense]TDQ72199.1 hydroxymethylglutaryl-CoA lyase [Sphingobacterium yanglingense]
MSNSSEIKLVECPRDAIQGIGDFIPTEKKITYINQLLASGLFEYIDFGSFVSPKAVPQLKDTVEVLEGLDKGKAKLLAIVANERGAQVASGLDRIDYLGYPFSISETFQQRNANSSVYESLERVKRICDLMQSNKQELVVYISMAFGNPYGDLWHEDLVIEWMDRLSNLGVNRFSIADTTSEASVDAVASLYRQVAMQFPNAELSLHLHARIEEALLKVEAGYNAGCRRFEGALLGYGGCPFAKDDLVGNIPMELLLDRFKKGNIEQRVALMDAFQTMIEHGRV